MLFALCGGQGERRNILRVSSRDTSLPSALITSTPPLWKAGVAGEQGKFTPDHYGEGMCLCKHPTQSRSHCQGLLNCSGTQLGTALLTVPMSTDPICEAVPVHIHVTARCRGHWNRYHSPECSSGIDSCSAPCQQRRMNPHSPGHLLLLHLANTAQHHRKKT